MDYLRREEAPARRTLERMAAGGRPGGCQAGTSLPLPHRRARGPCWARTGKACQALKPWQSEQDFIGAILACRCRDAKGIDGARASGVVRLPAPGPRDLPWTPARRGRDGRGAPLASSTGRLWGAAAGACHRRRDEGGTTTELGRPRSWTKDSRPR